MMTMEEMRTAARQAGYSYQQLSELSGVPKSTVQKVLGGATRSPRYQTLRALERVLQPYAAREKTEHVSYSNYDRHEDGMLREALPSYGTGAPADPYDRDEKDLFRGTPALLGAPSFEFRGKKQGEFRLEDLLALPDGKRAELIDGVILDLATPTEYHQLAVTQIASSLYRQAKEKQSPCRPFVSPIDVQLNGDDQTVVQPDVIAVCDFSKFQNGRYMGAPPFVIEVISPSSRRRDSFLKAWKYAAAGVREYWIVDLKNRCVIVHLFDEDQPERIYGMDQVIPVHISDGLAAVDFAVIWQDLTDCFPELMD